MLIPTMKAGAQGMKRFTNEECWNKFGGTAAASAPVPAEATAPVPERKVNAEPRGSPKLEAVPVSVDPEPPKRAVEPRGSAKLRTAPVPERKVNNVGSVKLKGCSNTTEKSSFSCSRIKCACWCCGSKNRTFSPACCCAKACCYFYASSCQKYSCSGSTCDF
jgi:hypothetical protein